jgi:peptidoglycan/xylan/chitin deacetylase (PgdA/CDA1 family)
MKNNLFKPIISLSLVVVVVIAGFFWNIVKPVYTQIPQVVLRTKVGTEISFGSLMYHRVGEWLDNNDLLSRSLTVGTQQFEDQLIRYKSQGYTTITAKQLYQAYLGESQLPKQALLLTFDDGFKDSYTNSFRLLKKYNMVGDFAIITGLIGASEFVTAEQLIEMYQGGMGISSHTVSHCNLVANIDDKQYFTDHAFLDPLLDNEQKPCSVTYGFAVLSTGQVLYELTESQKTLQTLLDTSIPIVIYPVGAYNKSITKTASQYYGLGFTTESVGGGVVTDPLAIPRTRIKGIQ